MKTAEEMRSITQNYEQQNIMELIKKSAMEGRSCITLTLEIISPELEKQLIKLGYTVKQHETTRNDQRIFWLIKWR